MKKLLLSLVLAGASSLAFGQGQGELTTTNTRTTTTTTTTAPGQIQTQLPPRKSPRAARLVPTEGAVQAAVRSRKPLQIINPAAPAQYGSGEQHASHDPKDTGKPKGIVLFAWSF
jgi:hypothetical protein